MRQLMTVLDEERFIPPPLPGIDPFDLSMNSWKRN
jgi:hypothetical protein